MHLLGDESEARFANAPGLYPSKPEASYILARHVGEAPLSSTFLSVCEPIAEAPALHHGRRIGPAAVEVARGDRSTDVLLVGAQSVESSLGPVQFKGEMALIHAAQADVGYVEVLGAESLVINGEPVALPDGAFEAAITAIHPEERSLTLDKEIPESVDPGPGGGLFQPRLQPHHRLPRT